jgi:hypothetical protein
MYICTPIRRLCFNRTKNKSFSFYLFCPLGMYIVPHQPTYGVRFYGQMWLFVLLLQPRCTVAAPKSFLHLSGVCFIICFTFYLFYLLIYRDECYRSRRFSLQEDSNTTTTTSSSAPHLITWTPNPVPCLPTKAKTLYYSKTYALST